MDFERAAGATAVRTRRILEIPHNALQSPYRSTKERKLLIADDLENRYPGEDLRGFRS